MAKTSHLFVCIVLTLLSFKTLFGAAADSEDSHDEVKLRDEEDVNKLREEAIAKLETPLEKMKIKVCSRHKHYSHSRIRILNSSAICVQDFRPRRYLPSMFWKIAAYWNCAVEVGDRKTPFFWKLRVLTCDSVFTSQWKKTTLRRLIFQRRSMMMKWTTFSKRFDCS